MSKRSTPSSSQRRTPSPEARRQARPATPDPLAGFFQRAVTLHRLGDLAEAEKLYTYVLARNAQHIDALQMLGVAHVQSDRCASGIELIRQALDISPDSATAWVNLGNGQTRLGKHEHALVSFDNAIRLKPDNAHAHFNRGIALANLHRHEEAIGCHEQALILDGGNVDALNACGNSLRATGRLDEATTVFHKALTLRPTHAESHNNLGRVMAALRQFDTALQCYDQALLLRPAYAEALNNRGNALHALGRFVEALSAFDAALETRPQYAEALNNRGLALDALDRHAEAIQSFDQALALKPEYPEALSNLGNTFSASGQHSAAAKCFEQALALRPDFTAALINLGKTLVDLNRLDEAIKITTRALSLQADNAAAHNNMGLALSAKNLPEQALQYYDKALLLQPHDTESLNNRGSALSSLQRYDQAFASFEQALAQNPAHAKAFSNRGLAFAEQNKHLEALENYARALELDPDYPSARWNKALSHLSLGQFDAGLPLYESRWTLPSFGAVRTFDCPRWTGVESLHSKRILLWSEQGLGDTVQFCRYASLVAERGAEVVLEAQAPLLPLLQSLHGVTTIVKQGEPLPPTDFECSLLSLPFVFGTRPATIPAQNIYLTAPAEKLPFWQKRIGQQAGLKIGLTCSGNAQQANDRNRSIPLEKFAPLLGEGRTVFLMQTECHERDLPFLAAHPPIQDLRGELKDFSDTAAAMMQLDLLISVCTSVAHVGGALGVPMSVLLSYSPDWRWLLERDDSPWYPGARLYRQTAIGDWDAAIQRLADDLTHLQRNTAS